MEMISTSTRKAFSEVDTLLGLIREGNRNKVPQNIRDLFQKEKDNQYIKRIEPNVPIKNQNLKRETLAIMAFLNLKYICDDDKEKQRLLRVYKDNEKRYQDEMSAKLNHLNERRNEEVASSAKEAEAENIKQPNELIKVGFFQKIINKIKSIFR